MLWDGMEDKIRKTCAELLQPVLHLVESLIVDGIIITSYYNICNLSDYTSIIDSRPAPKRVHPSSKLENR